MPGRRKPDELRKTAKILVRVTPALKQSVDEIAEETGESISSMVEKDLKDRVENWRHEKRPK